MKIEGDRGEGAADVGQAHHDGLCQQAGRHKEGHDGGRLAQVLSTFSFLANVLKQPFPQIWRPGVN